MNTEDITLITVLANLIIQPMLQYLLHSRCSHIKMGCIECDRQILKSKEEKEDNLEQVEF